VNKTENVTLPVDGNLSLALNTTENISTAGNNSVNLINHAIVANFSGSEGAEMKNVPQGLEQIVFWIQ